MNLMRVAMSVLDLIFPIQRCFSPALLLTMSFQTLIVSMNMMNILMIVLNLIFPIRRLAEAAKEDLNVLDNSEPDLNRCDVMAPYT